MKSLVLAIDFDGTIVEHAFPDVGKIYRHAKDVINNFYERGHEIIIWTCRSNPEHILAVKEFLAAKKIKYHKINQNSDRVTFGCVPKIYADFYIDDRCIFWKSMFKAYGKDYIWRIVDNLVTTYEKE